MPIYEYVCQRCGHPIEIMQKISDPILQTCPKCKGKKLVKKMSNSSFVLKGTGWYKTDYPSGAKGSPPDKKETKPTAEPVKAAEPSAKKDTK